MWSFKKFAAPAPAPSLSDKLEVFRNAVSSGSDFDKALAAAGLTLHQYGYALLQTNPKLRAALDGRHSAKLKGQQP